MRPILLHGCLHVVLSTEQGLQDDIVDSGPEQVHIDAYLLEMFAEGTQTPFVAKIVVLLILVLKELVILLVDGVVGQVHVPVVLVDFLRVGL